MENVTIVIPIFNDQASAEELAKIINEIQEDSINFLIVDNGSDPIITLQQTKSLKMIRTPTNLGFGGGILYGIQNSDTDIVGWMPGNLKIDPRDAVKVISQTQLTENEIIKCKRVRNSRVAALKTLIAGLVQTILLKEKMFDTGGTPTFARKSFIEKLKNPPLDYVFESFVLFIARKSKMKVIRPSIRYGVRKHGESHWQRGLRSEVLLLKLIVSSSKNWNN